MTLFLNRDTFVQNNFDQTIQSLVILLLVRKSMKFGYLRSLIIALPGYKFH